MIRLLKQLSVLFGWNGRLFLFVNLQSLNLYPFVKQKYFLFSCYFVRRIDTQWNRQCVMLYHHMCCTRVDIGAAFAVSPRTLSMT